MTVDIDIDHLSMDELEDLNDRIVERLKHLDQVRAQYAMMSLNLGTQVSFESSKQGRQFGTVIKFNRKTVSILTEAGRQWNVSPHLLTPIKDVKPTPGSVHTENLKRK